VFALIGLLCFTAGYVSNKKHNDNQVKAQCHFTEHDIREKQCSYSCTCRTSYYPCGENQCSSTTCSTCYKTCYDGYVSIDIPDIVSSVWMFILNNDDFSVVQNELNVNYAIGSQTLCYYDKNDNQKISFGLKDSQSSYIVGIVFCSLAGIVLLIWGIIESVWISRKVSDWWADKKRNVRLSAPTCNVCRKNKIENTGSVFHPVYSNSCKDCQKTQEDAMYTESVIDLRDFPPPPTNPYSNRLSVKPSAPFLKGDC